MDMMID